MTSDDIQKSLDNLEKTVKGQSSLPTILVTVVAAIGVWWLKYQLSIKTKELAAARSALEVNQEQALEIAAAAKDATLKIAADKDVTNAQAALAAHVIVEAAHAAKLAQLDKIQNWDALNTAAGTK